MRQTNSALTVGIHHCSFNQGLVSFFSVSAEWSHPKLCRRAPPPPPDPPRVARSTAVVLWAARYRPWQSGTPPPCPVTSACPPGAGVRSAPTLRRLPQTASAYAPPCSPQGAKHWQCPYRCTRPLRAAGVGPAATCARPLSLSCPPPVTAFVLPLSAPPRTVSPCCSSSSTLWRIPSPFTTPVVA